MRRSRWAWLALLILLALITSIIWTRSGPEATPGPVASADGSDGSVPDAPLPRTPAVPAGAAADMTPPLPVEFRDLMARADAGDARAACRLGSLLAQCSVVPPEFYSDETIARAREQERKAMARNDLAAADQSARFLLEAVTRRATCQGVPPELTTRAAAYLRQAALAGDPEARVRYMRGDAFLGIGYTDAQSLHSPEFDLWRREVPGMLQAQLRAGRPEAALLLLEAYSETGMALAMITAPDPLLDRAYLRLAQRLFNDFALPEGWPTPAADAALDAQAEELAAQWHAAHFDGRQYSVHRDVVGFAMSLFPQGDQPWVDETNWLPPCADPVDADQ